MDGTMWIALGIVGSLTLIVILITIKSRSQALKRKVAMLDTFNRIVAEERLVIHQKEVLKNRILAIDEADTTLIFVQNHSEIRYDIIQLTMINDCKIKCLGSKITQKQKNGQSKSEEHISEIVL